MLYGRVVSVSNGKTVALLEMPFFGLVHLVPTWYSTEYKIDEAVAVWHFFPQSLWASAYSYIHTPYGGEVEVPGNAVRIVCDGRSPWPLLFPMT
jgi:hypothetical protein